MKRNKSPGIPRKDCVSSNDTTSTGGSSGHSVDVQQLPPQPPPQQPLPSNNVKPIHHKRGLSQGSYSGAHQELAKNWGQTSNSSVEDQLNDEISVHLNKELASNSCTNGSGAEVSQSNQNNFSSTDELDSLIPQSCDAQRTRAVIEHFHSKISRTKESIKAEQNSRDENVNEYLKLAANADKVQLQRIKSVFEKKNQKSAQTIAHLQKKLDNYNKRIKDIEIRGLHGNHHKQTREMLRDVGQGLKDVGVNIKEGITGLSGGVIGGIKSGIHTAGETVMTKPKEFFKNRFGSSENINSAEKSNTDENSVANTVNIENESAENAKCVVTQSGSQFAHSHSHSHSTKYTSDDESSSMTSGSCHLGPNIIPSIGGSSSSPLRKNATLPTTHMGVTEAVKTPTAMLDIEHIVTQLNESREECHRLSEEVDSLKNHLQNECSVFHQSLQEERYRFERLEEQMNDLIELHQNEIENLKQNMADMEEKVQYQSEERLRDVHEMLESCQTRISRMEHQQHQHLQQLVNLDSLENSNARALVLKLINVVLTILQVVLLLVATIANILAPFLQTRVRIVTSIIVLSLMMILFQQWPDFGSWTRQKISENWIHFSSTIDSG